MTDILTSITQAESEDDATEQWLGDHSVDRRLLVRSELWQCGRFWLRTYPDHACYPGSSCGPQEPQRGYPHHLIPAAQPWRPR